MGLAMGAALERDQVPEAEAVPGVGVGAGAGGGAGVGAGAGAGAGVGVGVGAGAGAGVGVGVGVGAGAGAGAGAERSSARAPGAHPMVIASTMAQRAPASWRFIGGEGQTPRARLCATPRAP